MPRFQVFWKVLHSSRTWRIPHGLSESAVRTRANVDIDASDRSCLWLGIRTYGVYVYADERPVVFGRPEWRRLQ